MSPRLPQKPQPPRQSPERLSITRGLLAALLALIAVSLHPTTPPAPAMAEVVPVEPAEPLQEWTADAGLPLIVLPGMALGKLPKPDPRQKRPPCDPDLEAEMDGVCWTALKKPPPCPEGKAWQRGDTCYTRALRAVDVPRSGEPRTATIADP